MQDERTERAWAAGWFEGEGCIHCSPRSDNDRPRFLLAAASTDFDVLERFRRIADVGKITPRATLEPGRKPTWVWQTASRKDVLATVRWLYPFMGERRQAAITAVLDFDVSQPAIAQTHEQRSASASKMWITRRARYGSKGLRS